MGASIQRCAFENHLQPSMPVVTIKKSECLSVLSKAFFCLYHRNSYNWKDFPSINFDRLYVHSREFDGREKPKLQMILSYFIQLYQRHRDGTFVDEEKNSHCPESTNTWIGMATRSVTIIDVFHGGHVQEFG